MTVVRYQPVLANISVEDQLNRAKAHQRTVSSMVKYFEDQCDAVAHSDHPKVVLPPVMLETRVIDCLDSIHLALDAAVRKLAGPKGDDDNCFPISTSRLAFRASVLLSGALRGVPNSARRAIERLEPYNSSNNRLSLLQLFYRPSTRTKRKIIRNAGVLERWTRKSGETSSALDTELELSRQYAIALIHLRIHERLAEVIAYVEDEVLPQLRSAALMSEAHEPSGVNSRARTHIS